MIGEGGLRRNFLKMRRNHGWRWRLINIILVAMMTSGVIIKEVGGCNTNTKEVGVCLHVYLERDFLSLESIVYPMKNEQRREIYRYWQSRYQQRLPKLPQLNDGFVNSSTGRNDVTPQRRGRHHHRLTKEGSSWRRVKRSRSDNYAVLDTYGHHGWVEGPELEDYCSRLSGVITCFEEVLIDCDNGYDFFRYRHLLYSLEKVHKYLCHTPDDRLTKFLPFLTVIDCAETARLKEKSCHRSNVTVNVWNQILRLELGPELCNALNTQRSCLLDNDYVLTECGEDHKQELYRNVSAIFLATWCRLPMPPGLLPFVGSTSSHQHSPTPSIIIIALAVLHFCKTANAITISS